MQRLKEPEIHNRDWRERGRRKEEDLSLRNARRQQENDDCSIGRTVWLVQAQSDQEQLPPLDQLTGRGSKVAQTSPTAL